MTELPFRRLDDVRVIDRTDDRYGKRGCIGAVDAAFVPGRPYCVNFESTSAWYGDEHIVGEFAIDDVRNALEGASQALDRVVGHDDAPLVDVVFAMDSLRVVLKGLVNEVAKIEKVVDL